LVHRRDEHVVRELVVRHHDGRVAHELELHRCTCVVRGLERHHDGRD
jgi:hypothetical protein